jgi:predicted adenine nucleotide alpha hydrolase (AANH) superfamily ATPase
VCCGTCGAWVPKKLSHDYDVTLFYFNPNIHPAEEYTRRLEGAKMMADELGLELVEGEYNPEKWFEFVKGFANEPEGGQRCQLCFEHRLRVTAEYALANKFDCFATTLTVGRRKPASKVNPIGLRVAEELGIEFLDRDFKKAGGEDLSQIRARDLGVYRQEYCGCIYSKTNK